MQTAVMATADLSVRMSVCPSRSGVLSRKMKVRSCGLSIRTIILVSGKVKFIRITIRRGITPSEGVKVKRPSVASENLTNNQP